MRLVGRYIGYIVLMMDGAEDRRLRSDLGIGTSVSFELQES